MVTDVLTNAGQYAALGPRIARAIDYVSATDFSRLADGKHVVDGDDVFALVQRYTSKPLAEGRWEAHRRYIDLQLVVSGAEKIGYCQLGRLTAEPYDADKDLLWLAGDAGEWITLPAGSFTLFWPQDAHMPGIQVSGPHAVTKVVMKIAV
jgi:YhcH/YjgK/YiaL family protein